MKYAIRFTLIFCGFVFVFLSCSRSLYSIKQSEYAKLLAEDTLYIPLEDRSADIELLKQYGEYKKAERWARQDSVKNSHIMAAFTANYSFSAVQFVAEQALPAENSVRFELATEPQGDDDIREVVAVRLQAINWVVEGAPYSTFSKSAYARLARNVQLELERAAAKAK